MDRPRTPADDRDEARAALADGDTERAVALALLAIAAELAELRRLARKGR